MRDITGRKSTLETCPGRVGGSERISSPIGQVARSRRTNETRRDATRPDETRLVACKSAVVISRPRRQTVDHHHRTTRPSPSSARCYVITPLSPNPFYSPVHPPRPTDSRCIHSATSIVLIHCDDLVIASSVGGHALVRQH